MVTPDQGLWMSLQYQLLSPGRCSRGLSILIQKKTQSRWGRQDPGCRRMVPR